MHSDVLFLQFCFYLLSSGSICQGVHGIQIMRGLVLRFEGVKEFDSPLLLASVLEVDPLRMAC